jgi:UDP:flavonoid glycosyltransferase YjiC (YdhE family)
VKTFVLCWELGAGLGHVGRLVPIAKALEARGHRCVLMVRDLVQSGALLRELGLPALQGPVWLHQVTGLPDPLVSLSEILLGQGYLLAATLSGLMGGWTSALETTGADAVIGDYAPTAVLAARVLGLPSITVGLGFYMPPDVHPMPSFLADAAVPPERLRRADERVLATVNAVLGAAGRAPLARVSTLFCGDAPLLCTWPELDHYGRDALPPGQRWLGPSFMTRGGEPPAWQDGEGPRVFAYLKAVHPASTDALRALVETGCRTLCYMPEVAAGREPPVSSALIRYAKAPVDVAAAMRGARLMVTHAGEGTLVQGLISGVPVLMLPMHLEQALMAALVARSGAGINANGMKGPGPLTTAVRRLLHEPAFVAHARAFAERHATFDQQAQIEAIAEAALGLLRSR